MRVYEVGGGSGRAAVDFCWMGTDQHTPTYTVPQQPPTSTHITTQYNKQAINYEVWTEPQELLEASCDMGDRLPAEMSAEFGPALDFGHLPPVWWCVCFGGGGGIGSGWVCWVVEAAGRSTRQHLN